MSSTHAQEIENWMRIYESKPDSEVLAAKSSWKSTAPRWIAADEVLKRRARENDPTKPLLYALNEQMSVIAVKLHSVESDVRRPAYKTATFWIAIFGVLMATASFLRDYWDIKASWCSNLLNPINPRSV